MGIMVGGDGEILERVRPVLEQIGSNLYHMGPIGAGHMTKALNNFLAATNLAAASEALVVATKAGLDPEKVVAAFNASSGRRPRHRGAHPQLRPPRGFQLPVAAWRWN